MNSQRINGGVMGSGSRSVIKQIVVVVASLAGILRRAIVRLSSRSASVAAESRIAVVQPSMRSVVVWPENRGTSE